MVERMTTFANQGLTFDVVDSGPIDGEPVVLLHGFPQSSASWSAVSELLHGAGLRTFAPNQRGYSRGARPPGRFAYRMSELVADTVALIDAIGAPVHLVGHDWGAAVAWTTAAAHPDRVRTLTSLSVPHPTAFIRSMLTSSQALHSYYMALFQVPKLPELALGDPGRLRRGLRGSGMTDAHIDLVLRDVLESGALPFALNWYRAMPAIGRRPVPAVTVPTTHIWSTGDGFLSRRGAELTERYVHAPYRLQIVDGTHWLPEQRPELVAEAVIERARG
jgi:pimeloyl-ACP methyl ester carboxylesterase